jgi:hypothetical protein
MRRNSIIALMSIFSLFLVGTAFAFTFEVNNFQLVQESGLPIKPMEIQNVQIMFNLEPDQSRDIHLGYVWTESEIKGNSITPLNAYINFSQPSIPSVKIPGQVLAFSNPSFSVDLGYQEYLAYNALELRNLVEDVLQKNATDIQQLIPAAAEFMNRFQPEWIPSVAEIPPAFLEKVDLNGLMGGLQILKNGLDTILNDPTQIPEGFFQGYLVAWNDNIREDYNWREWIELGPSPVTVELGGGTGTLQVDLWDIINTSPFGLILDWPIDVMATVTYSSVPEPSSLVFFGSSLIGLIAYGRRYWKFTC